MFGIKLLLILLLLILLTISGTLVFIKGFLLSRSVIETKSQCSPEFALRAEDHSHHGVEGCWMHGRFKRAIIVIIDALKYEFMAFNSSLQQNDVTHYKNKLPSIHQLLKRKPLNSRLYKFIADPPTTTMQRLKGLTTGSLPTFVDAGANFHSYAITEDNLIDQMLRQDKKVKFFGDDTWLSLFPGKFSKSFDFPSFDVKDLHTVDNGILTHIYPEMRQSNWDVIIAHFLGVDHCGHKYGPNHSAMAEKLTQMDAVIRNITEMMRDDTVLFVMGDHGMTKTGDHGGDSADELEAGLFIYSPAQITHTPQKEDENVAVAQTDFVPTLALLMGLPIPFSNLGMVIPELFGHCPWWDTGSNEIRRVYHRVKALRLNAQQISTYLATYQQIASDLPVPQLRSLQQQINKAESDVQNLITAMIKDGATDDALHKFIALEEAYKSYIREARETCEGVWAKFDLKLIVTGLLTVAVGVSQSCYFFVAWSNSDDSFPTLAKFLIGGSALHLFYLTLHMLFFPETVPPLMAVILALVLIFVSVVGIKNSPLINNIEMRRYLTIDNIISSLILIMNCCLFFSNSFIVYENAVTMFFMQTLIVVVFLKIIFKNFSVQRKEALKPDIGRQMRKSKAANYDLLHVITQPSTAAFIVIIICCIVLRIASSFYSCREEQHSCEDSTFILPLSSLDERTRNQRYLFSVFCIAAMVTAVRYWLKHYGNMNGMGAGVTAAYYGPPLAALFIVFHWALQALPQSVLDSFPRWQQVLMAQIVYAIIIVCLIVILSSPVLVYLLPTRTDFQIPYQAHFKHIVPTLYNQLKVQLSESEGGSSDANKAPVVYGLGSVYSSSVVLLVSVVSLLLALMLGDGIAPSLLLATVLLYLFLELYSVSVNSQELDSVNEGPTWSGIVMLSLLSTIFFFATGHQATIPSIRFEAAYTGFYGDFNTLLLPGFLIWLNTFSGPIIFNLAWPLLIFWPLLSSALMKMMVKRTFQQKQNEGSWKGDFRLYDNATLLRKHLFRVCCGMIGIASVKLLAAGCAAALHRRHLMVWKIFAPRFIYEAAFFTTSSACAILAFLFVLRVDSALSAFIRKLPTKKQS
ncbi:unnamed protein product [Candidula unifasciata]|uniref:GPI ethanolamine phosphate transferase 3, catalytic subunit n=1 Tax=Candidula unifasciata TaxID=100452 RepID=A0A8S4A5M5_9EUPU|nr:unnamed protein product [Candidula unifasciata]